MKTLLALLSLPFVVLDGPSLRSEPKTDETAPAMHKAKDATELETQMEKIDRAWKKLRKQVSDPASNSDSLELVAIIKQSAEEGLKLIPVKAQDIPEADRAKFVSEYQEKMKSFLAEVDKLGIALKENRNEDAQKILGKLNSLRREGHRSFQRPE